jgi:hypothetical protein
MTRSYKSYTTVVDGNEINAYWNTDGTILIEMKKHNSKGHGNCISLKPLEIETVLKNKIDTCFNGVRPGLGAFAGPCRINVKIVQNNAEIKRTYEENKHNYDPVIIPLSILQNIFDSTMDIWQDHKNDIRPLVGLNCVAGSFDAMVGDFSQHRKNEEQRNIIKKFLDKLNWRKK